MARKGLFIAVTFVALILVSNTWARSGKEYKFRGGADGAVPQSGLVSDGAGNFYGTTSTDGLSNCGLDTPNCGTVFELSPTQSGGWTKTVIYEFTGGSDGALPLGTLAIDSSNNLYGTTEEGGGPTCSPAGCGTVFELSPNQDGTWSESTLYAFQPNIGDAGSPYAGVVFDGQGNLYGPALGPTAHESVFRLAPNQAGGWTESVIYNFQGGTDGDVPGPLVADAAGNLYGTSTSGGTAACQCGTVFELTQSQGGNWVKSILYSFTDGLDGEFPDNESTGGLIFDDAGNLYGTAFKGGSLACPTSGCGTVFRLSPLSGGAWQYSVIHTFNGLNGSKGDAPIGRLARDVSGNLFGTTYYGGGSPACDLGCGTIYKLSPGSGGSFTFTMIGAFNGKNGWEPSTGVVVDNSGNIYGTTFQGGNLNCIGLGYTNGCGVVFTLTP